MIPDRVKHIVWAAALLALGASAQAAEVDSLRIIQGKRVHEVERKETLYAIARAYDLDINSLLSANPSVRAEDDLRPGQILQLPQPVVLPNIPDVVPSDAVDPLPHHVVAPGETLYGIARQHGVAVAELEAANPGVTADLQPGQHLRLPGEPAPQPAPREPIRTAPIWNRSPHLMSAAPDTLRALALLPFQFDADTLPGGRYPLKVERLRDVAMEMLTGMQWAAEELANAGIPVVLDVRDSEPDSLGRYSWTRATVDSSEVILGPLRRSVLDSTLAVTSPTGKPHWVLTPQHNAVLAAHEQALMYAPMELAALEALGEEVARNHPTGSVLVLELVIESQEEQAAFRAGFERIRAEQGLEAQAGWVRHEVSTRFAEGVIDRIRALQPECVVIPGGPTSRAMVANFQTELQLADDLVPPRIYLHPQAREYSFLERRFFERHRVSLPTQEWMDWEDSVSVARVLPYRDSMRVEPSAYAWIAHEALLETARWVPDWSDRVPAPLHQRFAWRATGLETGFVNRAWRVQQYCRGRWVDGAMPCAPVEEE